MVKIVYAEASGRLQELDVKDGWTVMEGAVRNGIDGAILIPMSGRFDVARVFHG